VADRQRLRARVDLGVERGPLVDPQVERVGVGHRLPVGQAGDASERSRGSEEGVLVSSGDVGHRLEHARATSRGRDARFHPADRADARADDRQRIAQRVRRRVDAGRMGDGFHAAEPGCTREGVRFAVDAGRNRRRAGGGRAEPADGE
jgi:hypothetical protein